MPETPMYEYDHAIFAQHHIGRAGQSSYVLPIAVATGIQVAAHNPFGFGVLAFDFGHDRRTLIFTPDIHEHALFAKLAKNK